ITSNNYEENRIKQICDKYLISNFCQQISGNNNAIECQTRHTFNDSFNDDNNNSAIRWSGYKYGFWAQLWALLWRSYLLTTRNHDIMIAQMLFVGINVMVFGSGIRLFIREHDNRYALSTITRDVLTTMILLPVFTIIMQVLAGFILNTSSLQNWLQWIKYLNFLHYAYESLIVNQWRYIDDIPCINGSQSIGQCYGNGLNVIKSLGFYESNLYW
ncbi:unnamed protein product, partial [Medioppia subpectinata]